MDRGAWRATTHGGHKQSDTTEQITHALLVVIHSSIGLRVLRQT